MPLLLQVRPPRAFPAVPRVASSAVLRSLCSSQRRDLVVQPRGRAPPCHSPLTLTVCSRVTQRDPPSTRSLARCTRNCLRTVPWPSLLGFLLGVGGAAVAYQATAEIQGKVGPQIKLSSQTYNWVVVAIWVVGVYNIVLLAVGLFTTGRCREWCCRQPARRHMGRWCFL